MRHNRAISLIIKDEIAKAKQELVLELISKYEGAISIYIKDDLLKYHDDLKKSREYLSDKIKNSL